MMLNAVFKNFIQELYTCNHVLMEVCLISSSSIQRKDEIEDILVQDLLFADDCALVAHSQKISSLSWTALPIDAAQRFGLTTSLKIDRSATAKAWCYIRTSNCEGEWKCTQIS